MDEKRELSLKLYVLNDGRAYQEKLNHISELLAEMQDCPCATEIVDLARFPEQAEAVQILAVPTLIKERPGPPLRLIGNIDDIDHVVQLLMSNR